VTAKEFEALRYLIDVGGVRAKALRLALFQMRDSQEVTFAAGLTLTTEAKAKLYDIQQRLIRAAIAADDTAILDGEPPAADPHFEQTNQALLLTGQHPTCPACESLVLPDGRCVNGCEPDGERP
jgi:hypothetical protein